MDIEKTITLATLDSHVNHYKLIELYRNGKPCGEFIIVVVFDAGEDYTDDLVEYFGDDPHFEIERDDWQLNIYDTTDYDEVSFEEVVNMARQLIIYGTDVDDDGNLIDYDFDYGIEYYLENIEAVDGKFYWNFPKTVSTLIWKPIGAARKMVIDS